jgi:DNA primase
VYEEIKHSVKIGEVLRRYGYPTGFGDSYRIPCPIHRGRDSNFSVSERDGLWNCFSVCGRGGSVIDLVAALEDVSISEAVKKLREDYQLTPMATSAIVAREYKNKNERYTRLSEEPAELGIELPELTWLEEGYRGFRASTIQHWGLARTAEGVFIPHLDTRGRVYSYTIRRDDGDPKYDNVHGVSKGIPFGTFETKADIVRSGFAFLVEGQLDCIKVWQNGLTNVVALMGSSMSEQQAMILLSLTSRLVLLMDGDEAGRKASREIESKWKSVFDIKVVDLPQGKDPDDLSRKELAELVG